MNGLLQRTQFDGLAGGLVRRIRRRQNQHCTTILTYHSVAKRDGVFTRGTSLRQNPADFERQIEYLAEHYEVVRLDDLIDKLQRGETPHRNAVITFDDGYADTLSIAMPILYRRRLPMTIFPVTSVIGNQDLLWQHKLAWLLADGWADQVRAGMTRAEWPELDPDENLEDYVRRCFRPDIHDILDGLLKEKGTSGPELASRHRPYIEPEDMAAVDPEFVSFGNHTDTHPVLSALSPEQQRAEISTARSKLISITGRQPAAFAYPFGLKRHYDEVAREIARATGHRACLDMRRRINDGVVDPFELSRKPAPRGTLAEFEKVVEDWPSSASALPQLPGSSQLIV